MIGAGSTKALIFTQSTLNEQGCLAACTAIFNCGTVDCFPNERICYGYDGVLLDLDGVEFSGQSNTYIRTGQLLALAFLAISPFPLPVCLVTLKPCHR